MRVGVEVGGTFTDLVAVEGGKVVVIKVPSTPKSPDIGAFAALTASGEIAGTANARGMHPWRSHFIRVYGRVRVLTRCGTPTCGRLPTCRR